MHVMSLPKHRRTQLSRKRNVTVAGSCWPRLVAESVTSHRRRRLEWARRAASESQLLIHSSNRCRRQALVQRSAKLTVMRRSKAISPA